MVKITCADGVLTAVAKLDIPADVQTGFGTLTALSAFSLTVHSETRDLTCTLSDRSPGLGEFHVGDRVKVSCTNGVLTSIAKANVTSMTTGLLTALLPTSLTVLSDGGERACSRNGGSPSLEGYHVGDRVKMTCVNGVLTAIAKIDAPAEVKTGLGTLTALTDASLTVHTDGGDLTCRRGDGSPSLGDYHVGDLVKVSCTNGVLTTIGKVGTVTTTITSGVLTALSPTSLTVLSDGGARTCSRTGGSPSLDGYLVGQHVKATCVNGVLTAIEHL
jgi:hypothetical protein